MTSPINITVRQLRAFAEAYRMRNLTHAADSLSMTQPAMSALIRQFEESLGIQLFERTPRVLRPTKAADIAASQVKDILARIGTLQGTMHDLRKAADSVLAFSCVPALAAAVVPLVLAEFRRKFPDVDTVMFDEGDATLIERVTSGECEFSISSFAHDPEAIAQTALLADPLSVICAKASPLAAMARVTWADLHGQPVINLSKGVGLKSALIEHIAAFDPAYRPAFDVGFIQTALAMASQSLGVVVLPRFLVSGNSDMGGLVSKKLHDPIVEMALLIHTRQGHDLSAPATRFLSMLKECLLSMSSGTKPPRDR